MTWKFAYTSLIWPSVFVTLLFLVLFVFSWRRRDIPGALPFAFASLICTIWEGASALQLAAVDFSTQIFWFKVQAVCQLPSITLVILFLLEFIAPGRFLTRRNLILFAIPCFLFLGGALTNQFHHLSWRGFTFDRTVIPIRGPLTEALLIYGLGLSIINIIVVIWLFIRSPQNRWLAVLILLCLVVTRVIYVLVTTGRINSILPINALLNIFPFMVYSEALFRFRILDPIPLARQMAVEQLEAGMLILDPQGRIISLNPAGADILGAPSKQLVGQQIQSLLPECAGLMESPSNNGADRAEISLENGSETRHYQLECSMLNDWRGLVVGILLMLHDVTEQKLAQVQLIEQQQVMATLKEREQVARELHDELAQELAMINVQAQLVSGLLEAGKEEQAQNQLHLLAKAARESQVDVRGQIRKLSLSIDPEEGVLGALRHFLDMFRQMYGIESELILPELQSAISLAPMVEVQLLRIVQEAFTNIRKHANAKKVLLSLTMEAGCLKLIIEDDGIGFDPNRLSSPVRSFGLGIMSARAKDVGGSVAIHSNPGQGTQIIVVVPCAY